MKIIQFKREYDFGREYYLDLVRLRRLSLVSMAFYEEIYGGPPCLSASFGFGHLFEFLIGVHWFTLRIRFFAKNY